MLRAKPVSHILLGPSHDHAHFRPLLLWQHTAPEKASTVHVHTERGNIRLSQLNDAKKLITFKHVTATASVTAMRQYKEWW